MAMIIFKIFLLIIALPFVAFSQVPNSIIGRVVDREGMPLPSVIITLEQSSTSVKKSYTTKMDGIYHFDCLTEGQYSLTFQLKGFITEKMINFTYTPPQSLTLNRNLEIDLSAGDLYIRGSSDTPERILEIYVKHQHKSNNLEDAQITISDSNGIFYKSHSTGLCGNASINIEPGKRYVVRVSKRGFKEQVIEFEMPYEYKRLDVSLPPKETD
jgi:hypothetical protein